MKKLTVQTSPSCNSLVCIMQMHCLETNSGFQSKQKILFVLKAASSRNTEHWISTPGDPKKKSDQWVAYLQEHTLMILWGCRGNRLSLFVLSDSELGLY